MDSIAIQTTQNVRIDYKIASLGDRLLATLIDFIALISYSTVISGVLGSFNGEISIPVAIIVSLPMVFYFPVSEMLLNGQTLGKIAMKIQVVRVDGRKARMSNFLIRWLLSLIETAAVFGSLAIFTILINGQGKRLGDLAAGTVVIRKRRGVRLRDTILARLRENHEVTFQQVSRLNDQDIAILKQVLDRRKREYDRGTYHRLLDRAKELVAGRMGIAPPQLPAPTFLKTVIVDYNWVHREL